MFRDTYISYNESISPSDKLIADTIDKLGTKCPSIISTWIDLIP